MSQNQMCQIVAECGFVTSDTPHGRTKVLLHKGAIFSADAPEARHLLDSGMAVRVGDEVSGGLNADGEPDAAAAGKAPKASQAPKDTPKTGDDKANSAADLKALRDRAVKAGLDRTEVDKASAEDLRAALGEK